MTAFLTGSHTYGLPREDSDIDLAVLMSADEAKRFCELAGNDAEGEYSIERGASVRFGKLNVLVFVCEGQFDAWKQATQELAARRPVTRYEAVKAIDAKEEEMYEAELVATGEIPDLPPYEA